jgi:hypothetical protein
MQTQLLVRIPACQFIFEDRLTGDIYLRFLQDKLPPLLDDAPLITMLYMYCQHDGTRHTLAVQWKGISMIRISMIRPLVDGSAVVAQNLTTHISGPNRYRIFSMGALEETDIPENGRTARCIASSSFGRCSPYKCQS